MIKKKKINQAMTTNDLNLLILSLLISIIVVIASLIWILSGSRSGMGYLFGLTLAAVYYYMYFVCTLLMRGKNIALSAAFMLITYLIRLGVVASGLYLAFFVFELTPLFTVISFMITHGIVMLFSGGMTETLNIRTIGIWKERKLSA